MKAMEMPADISIPRFQVSGVKGLYIYYVITYGGRGGLPNDYTFITDYILRGVGGHSSSPWYPIRVSVYLYDRGTYKCQHFLYNCRHGPPN